ncbi:MAG: PD40 domain-containing protein, partial [Phycisphaerales bacterium]
WLANAIIRRTCEEAVDETVLVALGGQAGDYSNTLINISETVFWKADFGLRLIGVAESKRALKRRIRHMVTRPVPQSARIGTFSAIAILLIAALLLPMARGARPSREASMLSADAPTEVGETNSPADVNDVIVDPDTGLKLTLAKTVSGANNVIGHVNKLIMSPDARFLLFWGKVIPLDGTETFSYAEPERWDDVREVVVSPNGRYIAHGKNVVWLQPVSPETLRPDGPAKKLLDLRGERLTGWYKPLRWTHDSQVVFFRTYDAEGRSHRYAFSAATGDPVSYPDAAYRGLPSPDGTCIALTDTNGFWVKPLDDGGAYRLCNKGVAPAAECWSRDGKWLIGFQPAAPLVDARFVSYPEGQEYLISMPKDLAKDNNTHCVGVSPDRETLYFYHAGYKLTHGVWVASAEEGTALHDVDAWRDVQWAPDGKAVFHTRYRRTTRWEVDLLLSTLSADEPTQFALSPSVSTDAPLSVSPDGKWLLFSAAGESGSSTVDLNVTPLSMADHEARGPATVVFHIAPPLQQISPIWSPDSTKVALTCKANNANEQDIWVVFTDGRTPIRLTQTAAIERDLKWSPDGNMLAYICDDADAEQLKVIRTAGGQAVVLRQWAGAGAPLWGWSPDSKSLTIAEEGKLVRQPLSGGKAEPIVDLKEYGIERLEWHGWSPDGSQLALAHYTRNDNGLLAPYGQLLFARVEGDRLQQTGVTDLGAATSVERYTWSPDSTHVACRYEGLVATMPEGRLYAVNVDDIVERIEAGAIAPTGPKPAKPVTARIPPEVKPTPKPEPITGPVFSDNFDNGLSEYWQIVSANSNATHAVENGHLILSNCSARLSQIDWADYRVTVRVCVKEGGASGRGIAAIQTRATPSHFGTNKMDRYGLILACSNDAAARSLWLAFYYRIASGAIRGTTLRKDPCPLVQGKWYKVAFEVRGEQLRGYLDDKLIIEATDARLSKGAMWISAMDAPVLFDDFSVQRLP